MVPSVGRTFMPPGHLTLKDWHRSLLTAASQLPLLFPDGVPTARSRPVSHSGASRSPLHPGKWPRHPFRGQKPQRPS